MYKLYYMTIKEWKAIYIYIYFYFSTTLEMLKFRNFASRCQQCKTELLFMKFEKFNLAKIYKFLNLKCQK